MIDEKEYIQACKIVYSELTGLGHVSEVLNVVSSVLAHILTDTYKGELDSFEEETKAHKKALNILTKATLAKIELNYEMQAASGEVH
jgi:hypothetical protein